EVAAAPVETMFGEAERGEARGERRAEGMERMGRAEGMEVGGRLERMEEVGRVESWRTHV
ncbi:unnamed protein product, partial [Closterium sp. Naga37s-1]